MQRPDSEQTRKFSVGIQTPAQLETIAPSGANLFRSLLQHDQHRTARFGQSLRGLASTELCSERKSRGLVLGVYSNEDDPTDVVMLTENAAKYNLVRMHG